MAIHIFGGHEDYKSLRIELRARQGDNQHVYSLNLDNNELVTNENATIWARYLTKKIESLVTPEAMQSEEYQSILDHIRKTEEQRAKWEAGAEERERRERHRKHLHRTPTLGYIPDGLTVDYAADYGRYVRQAIEWTPDDSDDFLYQFRSLERMVVKCKDRCIENHRPDAAWAQSYEVLQGLPHWKARENLQSYFDQYKPRLRKLLKSIYSALVDSAIAWNHAGKLAEANELIKNHASDYRDWGMTERKMLLLHSNATITGVPVEIKRVPSKSELYQIRQAQLAQEEEERRRAEEELERNSLVPPNESLEKALFIDRRLDWECSQIGSGVYEQSQKVSSLLQSSRGHEAIVLFLQTVKYMCKHFVKDEHWTMFDDMYDPDQYCSLMARDINKAALDGKLSSSDIEYFHKAWEEIQAMEACREYGIANYRMRF